MSSTVKNGASRKVLVTKYAAADELTGEQRKLFSAMSADDQLVTERLFVHMNAGRQDSNEFMRGYTGVYDTGSRVVSEYLHDNMYAQTMLFKVTGRLDGHAINFEGDNSQALDRLDYAVQQASDQQPSLECMADGSAGASLEDGKKWQCCLGADGTIGTYSIEKGIDEHDHYIYVHVGKTQASHEFFRWIDSHEVGSLSVKQLIDSVQYRYLRSINKRNAQRLAKKAADALGLQLESVESDMDSHTENKYEVQPLMAIPIVHNESNMFREGTYAKKPCYYYYDESVCTARSEGALLLRQEPRSHLLMFPPVSPSSSLVQRSITRNAAALSFPTTLGTKMSVAEAIEHRDLLNQRERELVNKRITWEGKERKGMQWFNHRVVPGLYVKFDTHNDRQMHVLSELYNGDMSNVKMLKPGIVKISSNAYPGYDIS